jgi:hypothetical protein
MNAAQLLTAEIREKLRANAEAPGADHVPVVKFFNPLSWEMTATPYTALPISASAARRSAGSASPS